MKGSFLCWGDDGEQFARDVKAFDAETAAEQYAEAIYHGNDHVDEMEVHVREDDGRVRKFTVDVEFDVTFSAFEHDREER